MYKEGKNLLTKQKIFPNRNCSYYKYRVTHETFDNNSVKCN